MKVFITGGAGYIGSHIVELLVKAKANIIINYFKIPNYPIAFFTICIALFLTLTALSSKPTHL